MKSLFELLETVIWPQGVDASAFRLGFLYSSGSRERQCRNRMDMNMCVRVLSGTTGKIGGLLDFAQPQQRERPRPMHAKQHRIKRAEVNRRVGCVYRAPGIAGLALHK